MSDCVCNQPQDEAAMWKELVIAYHARLVEAHCVSRALTMQARRVVEAWYAASEDVAWFDALDKAIADLYELITGKKHEETAPHE